jgi:hypothetical protein
MNAFCLLVRKDFWLNYISASELQLPAAIDWRGPGMDEPGGSDDFGNQTRFLPPARLMETSLRRCVMDCRNGASLGPTCTATESPLRELRNLNKS